MEAIKEIPTNFRVYYTSMRNTYTQKEKEANFLLNELNKKLNDFYFDVSEEYKNKKENYEIDLKNYKEYVDNQYINGDLLRVAKGYLINKSGNYELLASRNNLYQLAKTQKEIYKVKEYLKLYGKLLSLSLNEYTSILKTYYNKVHEKMICDGYGYVFDNRIGWVCINRCHVKKTKPKIDYKATKENKAKLLAEGKRLYDKDEAEWCAANGIEYDGVDGRVYQNVEYVYEIPLIHCTLKDADKLKFTVSNYNGRSIRGKSDEELIALCNNDKREICKLDTDIRHKLDLCLKIDKILYTKFIRNEDQKPSKSPKINR